MAKGCDYSSARPDPACLRGHGIQFAVRYTSIGPNAKNMSAAEVRRLLGAGIALVTVFEEEQGHMLRGRAAGSEAAKASRELAGTCGMPDDRPHYFALDIDPKPLHDSEWDRVKAYLDGAASVLGRSAVGVYGGYLAIEKLVPESAPWGWQTFAWSGGKWSAKAHLQQHKNEVDLCGGRVDLDRTHPGRSITDYGQWGLEDDMTVEEFVKELTRDGSKTRKAIRELAAAAVDDRLGTPGTNARKGVKDLTDRSVDALQQTLRDLHNKLDTLHTKVDGLA